MKSRLAALILGFLCLATAGLAENAPKDPAAELARLRTLSNGLSPKGGEIALAGGIAKITVPNEFRYLDPKDTETVLTGIWGNPKGATSLGMLVPTGFDPLGRDSWAVIISYSDDGYVKDDDAAKIDYDELMKKMKEGTAEVNKERTKQGYPAIQLVGWAAPPRYDKVEHKMYWAKDLKFAGQEGDTLNYNIRMLGRHGVLVLNVVANMAQLTEVQGATPAMMKMVNFQDGHRYADFNSSTDKIATYGLAALVAGGIAAKAGLFKLLLVGLLAAKKFIIIAALAVASYFKKLFRRKKKDPDGLVQPTPGPPRSS